MFLLLLISVIPVIFSRRVHITLRENITQPCPGLTSDLVDKNSIRFSFDMLRAGNGQDEVTVTDLYGSTKTVQFPGCYRVRMSFRVTRPIKNPYVEAFLQLGTNIPCESPRQSSVAANICTNMTTTNSWCPTSSNERLRGFLRGKQTCQFCNLCSTLDRPEVTAELAQSVVNEGVDECDTDADRQTIQFRMCTPTQEQFRARHPEYEDKLNEYWQYLKQGVLTAVVHVLDREELGQAKARQCQQLCSTYEGKRSVSDSYKSTLLRQIEKLCTPRDEYAACVYHTLKFDLNSDF